MNVNRLFRFYLLPLLLVGGGIFFLLHIAIPRIAEREFIFRGMKLGALDIIM